MDGNALEAALGLIRQPANRARLRHRPLPKGVGELIELAAGISARIEEASTLSGELPHEVREAARFYVREVLLFPGADAYRVLGVDETASAAQIKLNFRRLQHWLHPDRQGHDWEAACAVRINQAWGHVRSLEKRTAYDARRSQRVARRETSAAKSFAVDRWRPVPRKDTSTTGWLLPVVAVAGCLALGWLAAFSKGAPPPRWGIQGLSEAEPKNHSLASAADGGMETMLDPLLGERVKVGSVAAVPSKADARRRTDGNPPICGRGAHRRRKSRCVTVQAEGPRSTAHAPVSLHVAPESSLSAHPIDAQGSTVTAAVPASTLSIEHVHLARERGRQLIGFLTTGLDQSPPIWNSLDALDSASALQEYLSESGGHLIANVTFSEPVWRISDLRANMICAYRRRYGHSGTLTVELVWRDSTWLVDRIQTDRR